MRNSTLRAVSPKRRKQNVIYEAAKKKWRASHDGRCEMIMAPDGRPLPRDPGVIGNEVHGRCWNAAMAQPHHRALRGKNLCNINTFSGLCFHHHQWTHDNPSKARDLGWLERT